MKRPSFSPPASDAVPPVGPVEVLGLDAAATMSFAVEQRRRRDAAAAEELRAITHWADLHRVEGDEVGSIDPDLVEMLFPAGSGDSVLGREGELRLAGQGAFAVTEFAVCQLAAAFGMSEHAARAYVGQGLELRDRLPRLWQRVMGGELPAWKALKIAEQTIPLTASAADYVDRHLAPFAQKMSFTRIMRTVEAAIDRHDPETAAERAAKAAEGRGVWIDHDTGGNEGSDGTSEIRGIVNTPDAVAFDAALDRVAGALAALGDLDRDQVRRAKAVGVLADPQLALDLTNGRPGDGAEAGRLPARRKRQRPTIHVHLHTDAVTGVVSDATTGNGTGHLARVERFGARSLEAVQQWLADLAPGAQVTVTPVVDLTEHIAADQHEAPDRLRNQVTERDDSCRFPWCGRQGVFDLDHIEPYVDPDEGGPPGQTNTHNIARLCRFHHRVKTHGGWTYQRDPSGSVTWTSPLGRVYTVDEHGTYPRT